MYLFLLDKMFRTIWRIIVAFLVLKAMELKFLVIHSFLNLAYLLSFP